jgi:hypothetical protein
MLIARGPWPKKKYGALVEAHGNLLGALALLASAYARLQPVWCRRLERSDHLHPAFVSRLLCHRNTSREPKLMPGRRLLVIVLAVASEPAQRTAYASYDAHLREVCVSLHEARRRFEAGRAGLGIVFDSARRRLAGCGHSRCLWTVDSRL